MGRNTRIQNDQLIGLQREQLEGIKDHISKERLGKPKLRTNQVTAK